MSGFSADWLALREPADHAARNETVARAVAHHFRSHAAVRVVDLGCGTGSNLRASMGLLPPDQTWRLVDWDPALLEAALLRLDAWSDVANRKDGALRMAHLGRTVQVETFQADLNADLARVLDPAPDLVTAAAFFDLVSAAWIERFVATLASRRLPLFTVLTYDGREQWSPPHPLDAAVLSAFHVHQGRDKGFGPAAGPKAADALVEAFRRHGYAVVTGESPWRLGPESAGLIGQLADGIAAAAVETGRVTQDEGTRWARARTRSAATVGHVDLFASPGG
jgi:SAM-dependent methyltransferase